MTVWQECQLDVCWSEGTALLNEEGTRNKRSASFSGYYGVITRYIMD